MQFILVVFTVPKYSIYYDIGQQQEQNIPNTMKNISQYQKYDSYTKKKHITIMFKNVLLLSKHTISHLKWERKKIEKITTKIAHKNEKLQNIYG